MRNNGVITVGGDAHIAPSFCAEGQRFNASIRPCGVNQDNMEVSMKCAKEHRLSYTDKAKALVDKMTLEEKVRLMSGWAMPENAGPPFQNEHYNYRPYPAAGNERLGIPPVMFCDRPPYEAYIGTSSSEKDLLKGNFSL